MCSCGAPFLSQPPPNKQADGAEILSTSGDGERVHDCATFRERGARWQLRRAHGRNEWRRPVVGGGHARSFGGDAKKGDTGPAREERTPGGPGAALFLRKHSRRAAGSSRTAASPEPRLLLEHSVWQPSTNEPLRLRACLSGETAASGGHFGSEPPPGGLLEQAAETRPRPSPRLPRNP